MRMKISKVLGVERGVEDCCTEWALKRLAGGAYMIEWQDVRSRECTEQ